MNFCKDIFLIIIFSGMLISKIIAQPTILPTEQIGLNFDQIGLEQGLSQSTVYAIVQDAQGFMWFGTQDGLNRYDGYSIKVFKHDPIDSNSISDNTIWCLMSDSKGNLWIGTMRGGVNKYVISENKFYQYQHNESDYTAISDNYVTSIYEDSNGNIWIGTRNKGLNLYNHKADKFTRILFNESDLTSLSNITIWAICEDHSKNLWIATAQGLYMLDNINGQIENLNGTHFSENYYIPFNKLRLNNDNIRMLFVDKKGILWIGTLGGGLIRYDVKTNNYKRYLHNVLDKYSVSSNYIQSIYEDSRQNLWLATYDAGLNMFDQQTDRFIRYSTDDLRTLYVDRSGMLWIGSLIDGVMMFDWRKNRFKHYLENNQNDKNDNIVLAILQDKEGELWVGTFKNGLKRFDQGRKKVLTYNFDNKNLISISSNIILSLCESLDGSIWVGTDGGGLNHFNKKTESFTHYKHKSNDRNSLSSNQILVLHEDQNGELWIGHMRGSIDRFNLATKTFVRYHVGKEASPVSIGTSVNVFYEDKDGTILAGVGNIVYRLIPGTNLFEQFQLVNEQYTSIKVNRDDVSSIYIDDKGVLWMGTFGGGLRRYNYSTTTDTGISFSYYLSEHGLSNDMVYGILPDNFGNIWLSTNKGISRFNPGTEIFRNYDVKDGLQGDEFNQGAYYASPSGELFFGGINGFNSFLPEEIEDNNYVPPIYLTTFKVFNEALPLPNPIPTNSKIELSYSQNFFSFEFVALNFTSPEKNQYSYMLEGFDNDWHIVSAQQRYASYTNLDPGEYILRVKGSNNDGIWNEAGTAVTIIITPPFWMTWWFRSLGIFLFLSLGFIVYRRRITTLKKDKALQQEISRRLIEKQEEERRRIAQEMHDSVGQGLLLVKNHVALMLEDSFESPSRQENLNKLSSSVSSLLKTVREISHNLRPPELDRLGLTDTLESQLLNFRESTSIKVTGELENIDGILSREMEINLVRIVQEALGNIIKHSGASECRVLAVKKNDKIFVSISDNGKGFDNNFIKNSSGMGLTGISERARILKGTFEIKSAAGEGTRIEILIPIDKGNG